MVKGLLVASSILLIILLAGHVRLGKQLSKMMDRDARE